MARVLILDDELEILRLVADELRHQGHETVAMRTPQLALEILKIPCNQFDLIICDVVMPNKNGIDFVKEIRNMPWFEGEIAIMSSYASMLEKEIDEAGVKHVLKKPFTIEGLVMMMAPFTAIAT